MCCVSAVVAGLCGGPGVCPGANIGQNVAIFEQVICRPIYCILFDIILLCE